ncbi:hypothetical protein [Actinoplanes derwentensis]|uniref:hypothetical protein n=1 Tax=Actinoplanes derwentensis TaxID=113562 RepID=UPI000B83E4CD|nr:hypothetical protein [Actinoplanes derwentensis]
MDRWVSGTKRFDSNRGFYIYSEGSYNTKKGGIAIWVWAGREMNFGPDWSTNEMNDKASSQKTL